MQQIAFALVFALLLLVQPLGIVAVLNTPDALVIQDICLNCPPAGWTNGVTQNCTDLSTVSGTGPYRACENAGVYTGLGCTTANDQIVHIAFDSSNVKCLSSIIGNLPAITQLSITNNFIKTVPASFAQLSSLQLAYLAQNNITSVPSLANLVKLTTADFSSNQLTALPAGLGSLTAVTKLAVDSNQITGSLPASVGSMISLQFLTVTNNAFSGSLPDQITQLVKLLKLDISNNQFIGPLPNGLGALTALGFFHGASNNIVSTIPTTFSALTNLNTNAVGGFVWGGGLNRLCGCWPSSLGTIENCYIGNASFCNITGAILPLVCSVLGGYLRPDCASCTDMVGCYSADYIPPAPPVYTLAPPPPPPTVAPVNGAGEAVLSAATLVLALIVAAK